ncbi:transmembrane protein 125 [Ambystoma mexicanum]|uniref:transmembrane protein 125 n=1 Tax=Ambystoma mexicanum TaxID=8296 RepID=UPI0037E86645
MAEMEEVYPPRVPVDPGRMRRNILDEHIELWWTREPRKSILCYSMAVLVIILCGVGGIVLLASTSSRSGEWRMAVGSSLCILALLILMKQLLSSAVQDMNCIQSRDQIDMLKSGGLSDSLVLLVSALLILVCGIILVVLASSTPQASDARPLTAMFSVGVTLTSAGSMLLFGVLVYLAAIFLCPGGTSAINRRTIGVFTISGRLSGNQRRETSSSMANLI